MRSRPIFALTLLSSASVLGGCAPVYRYTATSAARTPKPANCELQVTASMPSEGYEEIGVFEVTTAATNEISVFKTVVAPQACAAGGDLVVTNVNGLGNIVRAVVFAKKRQSASVAAHGVE
jgi:hypothetical protein